MNGIKQETAPISDTKQCVVAQLDSFLQNGESESINSQRKTLQGISDLIEFSSGNSEDYAYFLHSLCNMPEDISEKSKVHEAVTESLNGFLEKDLLYKKEGIAEQFVLDLVKSDLPILYQMEYMIHRVLCNISSDVRNPNRQREFIESILKEWENSNEWQSNRRSCYFDILDIALNDDNPDGKPELLESISPVLFYAYDVLNPDYSDFEKNRILRETDLGLLIKRMFNSAKGLKNKQGDSVYQEIIGSMMERGIIEGGWSTL